MVWVQGNSQRDPPEPTNAPAADARAGAGTTSIRRCRGLMDIVPAPVQAGVPPGWFGGR